MNKVDSMGWSPKHFKDVHGGVLDAHHRHDREILRTGVYHALTPFYSISDSALGADTLYASAILVPCTMTLDYAAIHVTSAGAGGTNARLGLYNDGTNLYPGTLIEDFGEVDVDGTGVQAVAISPSRQLTKGIYWLAIVSDGTPTCRGHMGIELPLGVAAADFNTAGNHWAVSFSYAALPNPFTTGGTLTQSPRSYVHLRLESND